MEKDDKIKGVTLRVAVFFGLTTFTLCIAIFYVESVLDEERDKLHEKVVQIDSLNNILRTQNDQIQSNENEIQVLREELDAMKDDMDN